LKRKRKAQDPDGRKGRVQEGSTQEIPLGKNARRKARKGGKEEELHQRFQKDEALTNARISAISERKFDVGKPSTYPDELLEIPFANAVSQIILKTEIGVLESARDFAPGVHIGQGVSLPAVFNYKISANLRFLFQEKLNGDFPSQSYNAFAKCLR
jgi:hypothetical protein